MKKQFLNLFIFLNLTTGTAFVSFAQNQTPAEETPVEIMTKACNSYKNYNQVYVKALISIDEINENSNRVQKNSVVEIQAKLPNKFKASSQGDENFSVFYNGSTITALDTSTKFYAQVPLAGDLHDFLDATESLNQPTPALDMIVPKYCLDALSKMDQGELLGQLKINDKDVQHLAFKTNSNGAGLSYQIWVDKSQDRYVIRKSIITTSYEDQQLDYEYLLISEDLTTPIFDGIFDFLPDSTYSLTNFFTQL